MLTLSLTPSLSFFLCPLLSFFLSLSRSLSLSGLGHLMGMLVWWSGVECSNRKQLYEMTQLNENDIRPSGSGAARCRGGGGGVGADGWRDVNQHGAASHLSSQTLTPTGRATPGTGGWASL